MYDYWVSIDVIGLCLQRHPEPCVGQPKHSTEQPKRENTKTQMLINRGHFSTRSDEAMGFFVTVKRSEPCGKLHVLHALPITSRMTQRMQMQNVRNVRNANAGASFSKKIRK